MLILSVFLLISSQINLSFQSFNIDDFGARADDASFKTALANGKAFNDAILAANSSNRDRLVIVSPGKNYTILPFGIIDGIYNLTIQIDGIFNAWHENIAEWPNGESRIL